jgi:hypothetical protein
MENRKECMARQAADAGIECMIWSPRAARRKGKNTERVEDDEPSMIIKPVERQLLADLIFRQLRNSILTGELAPAMSFLQNECSATG